MAGHIRDVHHLEFCHANHSFSRIQPRSADCFALTQPIRGLLQVHENPYPLNPEDG